MVNWEKIGQIVKWGWDETLPHYKGRQQAAFARVREKRQGSYRYQPPNILHLPKDLSGRFLIATRLTEPSIFSRDRGRQGWRLCSMSFINEIIMPSVF